MFSRYSDKALYRDLENWCLAFAGEVRLIAHCNIRQNIREENKKDKKIKISQARDENLSIYIQATPRDS